MSNMISDEKVLKFKNAKTVWVKWGKWVEAIPHSFYLESGVFAVIIKGKACYRFSDFELEKPQQELNLK